MTQKYIVITLEDAKNLVVALDDAESPAIVKLVERFAAETGADMQEIVDLLKGQRLCPACVIEGQERTCQSIGAQKLGRRLNRLLERARGERTADSKKDDE